MMRFVVTGMAVLLFCTGAGASEPTVSNAARSLQGLIDRVETTPLRNDVLRSLAGQLRALGPGGLGPMLEALQPDAPALAALRASHPERAARFEALLLDAVGRFEDPAAAPTLQAAVGRPEPEVASAGARGLGKLCRPADLAFLATHDAPAAIEGLGFCRRPETGPALQRLLRDESTQAAAARAAGNWGSSWAWQALGAEENARSRPARIAVAGTLASALAGASGERRIELTRALRMLDLPEAMPLPDDSATGGKGVR